MALDQVHVKPSDFVESFFNIPQKPKNTVDMSQLSGGAGSTQGNVVGRFSLKERPYLYEIYNTAAKDVLLMCGRQVEKSTTIGNRILTHSMLLQNFRSMYVAPRDKQAAQFSRNRIRQPIKESEELSLMKGRHRSIRAMLGDQLADNVYYQKFTTGSEILIEYAYLNADRVRGGTADSLCMDEFQDLLFDLLPVIDAVLFTSAYQFRLYAGTPKSVDNTINIYWEKYSTKNEWAIPCDACGHWNILGYANVGKTCLICSKCGAQIHPHHERAQWVSGRDPTWLTDPPLSRPFVGYRIPQPLSPNNNHVVLLDKIENNPPATVNNEVWGFAHDSADKLFSEAKIRPHCDAKFDMERDGRRHAQQNPTVMGIDWAGGSDLSPDQVVSTTAVTIMTVNVHHCRVVYFKRYTGREADPDFVDLDIARLVQEFNVKYVCPDFGGGYQQNFRLQKKFGAHRVIPVHYTGVKLLTWNKNLGRYMAARTEVIQRFAYALTSAQLFKLPSYSDPVARDALGDLYNVYEEMDAKHTRTIIQRTPGTTDDFLHSMVYAFIASMFIVPRPDIIRPTNS